MYAPLYFPPETGANQQQVSGGWSGRSKGDLMVISEKQKEISM